jgi:hypothetical protein
VRRWTVTHPNAQGESNLLGLVDATSSPGVGMRAPTGCWPREGCRGYPEEGKDLSSTIPLLVDVGDVLLVVGVTD